MHSRAASSPRCRERGHRHEPHSPSHEPWPAVHVGTTVALDKGWSLLASVSYLRGRSDVTATSRQPDGSTSVGSTRVTFGQVGYTLALAYSY